MCVFQPITVILLKRFVKLIPDINRCTVPDAADNFSISSLKERPTVLFFWFHGTPRSGDSYDLQVNEA